MQHLLLLSIKYLKINHLYLAKTYLCVEGKHCQCPTCPLGSQHSFIPCRIREQLFLEDVAVLIPRICDCVTLHGERNFADVIRLRVLRKMIILHYLFAWAQWNLKIRGDLVTEAEAEEVMLLALKWRKRL